MITQCKSPLHLITWTISAKVGLGSGDLDVNIDAGRPKYLRLIRGIDVPLACGTEPAHATDSHTVHAATKQDNVTQCNVTYSSIRLYRDRHPDMLLASLYLKY